MSIDKKLYDSMACSKWKGEFIWDDIQITVDSSQMEIFKDLSRIEDPNSLVNGDSFRNFPIPCLVQYSIPGTCDRPLSWVFNSTIKDLLALQMKILGSLNRPP